MKKYIISAAVAAALIVAGGFGVKSSLNPQLHLSDLAKANVEALANWEAPDSEELPQCNRSAGPRSICHAWFQDGPPEICRCCGTRMTVPFRCRFTNCPSDQGCR